MKNYNTDFLDFLDIISQDISEKMREIGWSQFINSYHKNKNDTYVFVYGLSNEEFPLVLTLKFHFPWSFYQWPSKKMDSNTYMNTPYDEIGGGKLTFEKKFNFELLIDHSFFSTYNTLEGFEIESDEFENIETEKFTLDLSSKERDIKKFTKAEVKQIIKWLERAVPVMTERLKVGAKNQIARRFDEILPVNEELALKYAPDYVKDIFIF